MVGDMDRGGRGARIMLQSATTYHCFVATDNGHAGIREHGARD